MDVKLIMFRTNGQRKDFPIINPATVIGRGENCDLRVPLLSVSRRHCELRIKDEKVRIKDLASSNGTYVNNARVNEAEMHAGDRLAVGPIVFTLQIGGTPEDIRPVKTKGQRMAEAGVPGTEEVVDLDGEVVAQPGASVLEGAQAPAVPAGGDTEDIDPISALEALASESEQDQNEQK